MSRKMVVKDHVNVKEEKAAHFISPASRKTCVPNIFEEDSHFLKVPLHQDTTLPDCVVLSYVQC